MYPPVDRVPVIKTDPNTNEDRHAKIRALLDVANRQIREGRLIDAAISIRVAADLQDNGILQILAVQAMEIARAIELPACGQV